MGLESYTNSLAAYLPNDRLFASKFIAGTNLRGLLRGLSPLARDADDAISEFKSEYYPETTTKLLEEWEQLLGLPDDCFDIADTIEERQRNVMIKLVCSAVQTLDDFQALLDKFGITISIQSGRSAIAFPLIFPIPMIGNAKESRFTLYIELAGIEANTFPYTFPIVFGSELGNLIECVARKIAPANVQLIFNYIDSDFGLITESGIPLVTESGGQLITQGI